MASSQTFIVMGAGGHGKVIAETIRAAGHVVAGFTDSNRDKMGQVVEPGGAQIHWLQDDFLQRVDAGGMIELCDAVVIGIGNNRTRVELLSHFASKQVPPVVHPSAVVSPSAYLGPGSVVFAGAVINTNAMIGAGVIVNSGAIVEHDCQVIDGAHISPNAAICGNTRIGARSWIGAGSTVIHQIRVGDDAVVGAGAVVINDVADGQKVVGNPARSIK